MALRGLERITLPDTETFFREYVYKRQPVIITNLFEGDPIREIRTIEDASKAFGSVKLVVHEGYDYATAMSEFPPVEVMTFDAYWDYVRANAGTKKMCTEYRAPARVAAMYTHPDACLRRSATETEVLDLPRDGGDYDLLANAFVANRGNITHLHYDGDHRQVFLYQVFGRKKVILFQPSSAPKLGVLGWPGFSHVYLENMGDEEKRAFIADADGYEDTIHPGEAVYMPMLIWHYLEYTDDAMSVNVRFGRNKYGRFLSLDNFHRDVYLQNFASELADTVRAQSEFGEGLSAIISEYSRPASSVREKVSNMRRIFRGLCAQRGLPETCPPELEESELDVIVRDIGGRLAFPSPEAARAMRDDGPIQPEARRFILEQAGRLNYPKGVLEHVMHHAVGKKDLDQLNQAEADQFLRYLSSPGAAW